MEDQLSFLVVLKVSAWRKEGRWDEHDERDRLRYPPNKSLTFLVTLYLILGFRYGLGRSREEPREESHRIGRRRRRREGDGSCELTSNRTLTSSLFSPPISSFPLEILHGFALHVDTLTLSELCLICHALLDFASPLFYEDVVILPGDSRSPSALVALSAGASTQVANNALKRSSHHDHKKGKEALRTQTELYGNLRKRLATGRLS